MAPWSVSQKCCMHFPKWCYGTESLLVSQQCSVFMWFCYLYIFLLPYIAFGKLFSKLLPEMHMHKHCCWSWKLIIKRSAFVKFLKGGVETLQCLHMCCIFYIAYHIIQTGFESVLSSEFLILQHYIVVLVLMELFLASAVLPLPYILAAVLSGVLLIIIVSVAIFVYRRRKALGSG